jgi:SAM-dependent methyltransferase
MSGPLPTTPGSGRLCSTRWLLGATVDFLTAVAGPGPAAEFGIGTGRVALLLSRRIRVSGIEVSRPMVGELRRQGGPDIDVVIGDFATARPDGTFTLVYLLSNTITNVTTQDEQVEAFRNAAAHLRRGGCFVVENYIPALLWLSPEQKSHVFAVAPDHVGIEEYDLDSQIAVSRHWWAIDGELKTFSSPHRYVWPAELDLMARLAGMILRGVGVAGTGCLLLQTAKTRSRCGRSSLNSHLFKTSFPGAGHGSCCVIR